MVFNTLDEIEKEIEILKYLNSKSIDGIILLSSSKEDIEHDLGKIISTISTPLILIDREIKNINCDGIFFDNIKSTEMITKYLFSINRNRTVLITGEKKPDVAIERVIGFRNMYKYNDIKFNEKNIIYSSFYNKDIIENKIEQLFKNIDFDSVICCNNLIARIVIKYALKNNIKINEDIVIATFDRLWDIEDIGINLAYIHFDDKLVAEKSINLLLNKTKGLNSYVNSIKIQPNLISHNSGAIK